MTRPKIFFLRRHPLEFVFESCELLHALHPPDEGYSEIY
jgi:hypothetical protein